MERQEQGVQEFRLPDVGEGLVEAELLRWYVQPGDEVAVNQTICEVETAKAAVELPSPYAGTVRALLAEEGSTVEVGSPIITVDDGSGGAGGQQSGGGQEAEEKPLVGYGQKAASTQRRPRRNRASAAAGSPPAEAPAAAAEPPRKESSGAGAPNGSSGRALAKPPVRKLAKDLGVDLSSVTPTGSGGIVTREDVQRASAPAAETAPPAETAAPAGAAGGDTSREERIPVKGVRKRTAAAMVDSAFTAPHVTEFLQVDVTRTVEAVEKLRERSEFADVKVSPLLLVAKALLTAVRRHPGVNASWDEQAQEIVVKHYVNLGVAAATERGLVVPNIKEAQTKPLPDLARELGELTEAARAGTLSPSDMSNGTITVTNVGVFGVDAGTPILNPGEAAILAFGQIREMPWVHDGQLTVRKVTTLSLSFDHRMVDGELGSKVLRDVGAVLEDPETTSLAWG
ncbi:pyruvate dehydrogenase E2 component (dihydrolipoamide acetyltransferase) [Haloactinospora alba]|uniref:Dihydrolipoamide acetyltransferase component of pyruvate dehydrogenase complex n=1 Tax=Haloactinospora alba TaxID=405555 RepID=A0A543NAJ3_9ACTN|nr:dihydrolipoamide acetyltransferase family protein [Haloactinospora alba]TQN28806.1 pyruvate dehydrogenase E2 component (dihydrolipoamide acetyltransferase) [Haloactinospora alba]